MTKRSKKILLLGGRRNPKQAKAYDQAEKELRSKGFAIINPWEGMGDYWKCYTYLLKYTDVERKKMESFWQKKLQKLKNSDCVILLLTMPVAPGQIIECWEAKKLGKEIYAIYLDKEYPNCTHLIKCFSKIYQSIEDFTKDHTNPNQP